MRATVPTPASLRDSTQIVLPCETLDEIEEEIEEQFVVTVVRGEPCRIVGSPVEIKALTEYLARRGISVE